MTNQFETSILRLINSNGKTVGTGFLVAPDLAVTCAHVVVAAGAIDGDTVQVQFTGRSEKISALVDPKYWRDVKKGDVAFLRLDDVPDEIHPLPLGLAAQSQSGESFYSFGYASAAEIQGIGARGEIITFLPDKNYLQIRAHEADHGISGGPVLDEKRDVVIGMISMGHTSASRNAETTFAIPTEFLLAICPEIKPSETCPFMGLDPFTKNSEQYYFGRNDLIQKFTSTLRGGCRFLAILGPSGCGKSSLVQAKLLPDLEKGLFAGWKQVTKRPSDNGFENIIFDVSLEEKTLLYIDQFEELFTVCSKTLCQKTIQTLVDALGNPNFALIITLRDDFLNIFNRDAGTLAQSDHLKIENIPGTLKREDLTVMIKGPAEKVRLKLDDELADLIIRELEHAGIVNSSALPLLEFTLTQLWQHRADGRLTYAAYQSIGGVTGSLARWADETYTSLGKEQQQRAEQVLTSLVHLGDPEQGLADTRQRRALDESDENARSIIQEFTRRRLLSTNAQTVELIHDALIREWNRLGGWISTNRKNLLLIQKLRQDVDEWHRTGQKDQTILYRGQRLNIARKITSKGIFKSGSLEARFLEASAANEKRSKLRNLAIGLVLGIFAALLVLAGPVRWAYIEKLRSDARGKPVEIPGGPALLGDKRFEPEQPFHQQLVDVKEFRLDQNEVTYQRYRLCHEANRWQENGCTDLPPGNDSLQTRPEMEPITHVTPAQAMAFCKWVGGNLPSQVQWERAARGANGRMWPWGNEDPTPERANLGMDMFPDFEPEGVVPVNDPNFVSGSTPKVEGAITHLLGNVAEITADPETCLATPFDCPTKWDGQSKVNGLVVHGMGFVDQVSANDPNYSLSYTALAAPGEPAVYIGFRCAYSKP